MSVLKKTDSLDWLLMEWKSGSRTVVHVKSLVGPSDEKLRPGDVINVYRRGEQETATIIAHAQDRATLDAMVKESVNEEAGPSSKTEAGFGGTTEEDYSSSGSPSDDEVCSADSDMGDKTFTRKMREETTRKCSKRRRTSLTQLMSIENLLSDSTKWKNEEELENEEQVIGNMDEVEDALAKIFNLIGNLKWQCEEKKQDTKTCIDMLLEAAKQLSETPNEQSVEDEEYNSDELNRSTDNVLVTNKHNFARRNERVQDEWVPIGSGKTLVHKDKFRRVNWRSFTLATRTLLVALFSKRILATHSLTGKKSPAFQEKPAKRCLDPKIIYDVILEIKTRFKVKENVIRQIITTKCADECKMSKMRENKRKSENDENVPPEENEN